MSGDDHVEFKLKDSKTLHIFLSDKFRKALPVDDFDFELTWVSGNKRSPLKYTASPKSPYTLSGVVSSSGSDESVEVKFKRKAPPKGHVVGSSVVKISMADLMAKAPAQHNSH